MKTQIYRFMGVLICLFHYLFDRSFLIHPPLFQEGFYFYQWGWITLRPFRDMFRTWFSKSRPTCNFDSQTEALKLSTHWPLCSVWQDVGLRALIVLHRPGVMGRVPWAKNSLDKNLQDKRKEVAFDLVFSPSPDLVNKKMFLYLSVVEFDVVLVSIQSAKKCLSSCTVLFCPQNHEWYFLFDFQCLINIIASWCLVDNKSQLCWIYFWIFK